MKYFKKIILLKIKAAIVVFALNSLNVYSNPNYCKETETNKCVTPYGMKLGENDGISAYSNCRSECVNSTPNHVQGTKIAEKEGIYSGIKWQCVEYARRWWIYK